MSSTKILLWAVATLLAGSGCTRYQAPCTVGEPKTLTTIAATYAGSLRMGLLSEDRVSLLRVQSGSELQINGWTKSTEGTTVDAMIFNRHGAVSMRHQVIPGLLLSDLSWDPLQSAAWLGDALAVLSTQVGFIVDSQGGRQNSRQLQVHIYDERGLRAGPIVITACADCTLSATVRSVGDEALVVFRRLGDNQEDRRTSWVAVGAEGAIRAVGTLGELAADETIDVLRFNASQREDAIFIPTSNDRVWLADNRFRRLTAPLTAPLFDEWDWDLAGARIARAWIASPYTNRDILTTQVGFGGQELLAEDRISTGSGIVAMATASELVGVVLLRDDKSWFVARGSDGAKLGGDIPFDSRPLAGALVPTGASSFLLYTVEHLDPDEFALQSRTMECHP